MEIELRDVYYKDILVGINYVFEKGKITGVIGSKNSGKSVLCNVILRYVDIDRGKIFIDGKEDIDSLELLRKQGYVFFNSRDQFVCDNVYDELCFGLKQFKFRLGKMDNLVYRALEMVGLDGSYLMRSLNSLSNGEKKRVAIASALVLNPSVIVVDSVNYLDSGVKRDLISLFRMLKDKYGKTVIIISNDMDFVYGVSDNFVVMDKGSIVSSGKMEDIDDDIFYRYDIDMPKLYKFVSLYNDKYKKINNVNSVQGIVREVIKVGK